MFHCDSGVSNGMNEEAIDDLVHDFSYLQLEVQIYCGLGINSHKSYPLFLCVCQLQI